MVGGKGDDQLWGSGRGAIAGCSGRGAIAGCHCSVLWLGSRLGGRVTSNFEDVVPLLGAIIMCYGRCHCRVPLEYGMVEEG